MGGAWWGVGVVDGCVLQLTLRSPLGEREQYGNVLSMCWTVYRDTFLRRTHGATHDFQKHCQVSEDEHACSVLSIGVVLLVTHTPRHYSLDLLLETVNWLIQMNNQSSIQA